MANLTTTADWDSVPELAINTVARGGPGGPMNTQAQALGNRTDLLKKIAQGFNTVAEMMAFTPKFPMTVFVAEYAEGYGHEGGGWFKWSGGAGAHDGFMTFMPTSNPETGRWVRTAYTDINVKMAGCKGDGSIDDSARFQVAVNYFKDRKGTLVIPAGGNYAIQEIIIEDSMYILTIDNKGSYLEARSIVPREAMMSVVNCVGINFIGVWWWNGADNPNYRATFQSYAKTGTSQCVTRVNLYNFHFRNCGIGISNGRFDNDYQCSEMNVFGANFLATPCPVYNGGSNAGLQLVGCNVTSEKNAAFPNTREVAIHNEGGFVKVGSGSMVTNPTAECAVLMTPCMSAMYGNQYGTVDIVGAHCEINSPLIHVSNPRGLPAVGASMSSANFSDNTGSCGGDVTKHFQSVFDTTYAGIIDTRGNKWYSEPGVVRSGMNAWSASPFARFLTDSTSLGRGFKNWLSGISGGRVIHDEVPVVRATGLSATFPANVGTPMKFQTRKVTGEHGRYADLYDSETGIIDISKQPGGFSKLRIRSSFVVPGFANADFYVKSGNQIVANGTFNVFGNVDCVLYDVADTEKLTVVFQPYAPVTIADNGVYNYLEISGETRSLNQ